MKINSFFTNILGAPLKNVQWSWGAVDPLNYRVFLRIWQDQCQHKSGKEYCRIARDIPRRRSNGFLERNRHIELLRNGAQGYGVVCVAADPTTTDVRKIKSFDEQFLVQFGNIVKADGNTYAEVIARVAVTDLDRIKTGESTLIKDLQTIARRKIEATEKEALVNARVGQGLFRQLVLQSWGNACAVTGSSVLYAIRASHIKPWRNANDDERLDPFNGLPLVANLDALFDAGLITFDDDGTLLVSKELEKTECLIFGLVEQSLRKAPPNESHEYLEYHRHNIFRE